MRFLLISNHLNTVSFAILGPLYSLLVLNKGGSAFHAGASWALFSIVAGILMFYFAKVEDHVAKNRRMMIVVGYFILSLGALGYLLVNDLFSLYAVQLINAAGIGMLDPALKSLFSRDEDAGKEAEEWADLDGWDHILMGIGAFIGGYIIVLFNFYTLLFLIFLLQLFGAIFSVKILNMQKDNFDLLPAPKPKKRHKR